MSSNRFRCESCGNEYEKAFQVIIQGETHTFDCFECAINVLAPLCGNCGTPVIGHGEERDNLIYCCGHCARQAHGSNTLVQAS